MNQWSILWFIIGVALTCLTLGKSDTGCETVPIIISGMFTPLILRNLTPDKIMSLPFWESVKLSFFAFLACSLSVIITAAFVNWLIDVISDKIRELREKNKK